MFDRGVVASNVVLEGIQFEKQMKQFFGNG